MLNVRTRRLLLLIGLPALILVLLYAALGFWLVPRLIRSNAQGFVAEHYHRQLALGQVRFNPFTLRLDIRDFSMPDSDGQPMLAFTHLLVDLTIASVWHWGPDFEAILLEQPYARVVIKADGSLNLSQLALPSSAPAKTNPNPAPARLFINRLSVQGGNVAFKDDAHPSEFRTEIKPITFDLRNFSTVGKDAGMYVLSGTSDAGERFSWSGSLSANPLASHGRFEVANLRAQTVWNYIRDSVHFELPSGAISINGEYDFTGAATPIGLTVDVHDVNMSELGVKPKGAAEDYLKLTKLDIHETHADLSKHTVTVGSVHLTGGEVRAWIQSHGAVNLLEMAATNSGTAPVTSAAPTPAPADTTSSSAPPRPPPAENAASSTPASTTPWTVAVPDITLDGLTISAEDRQVTPAVVMRLDELTVRITGFSTAKTNPIAITVGTKINRAGKLDVKADLSPDFAALKAHAELTSLDLTAFQPYVARQTAMTLRSGLASTKLDAERGPDGKLAITGQAELAKLHTVDNVLQQDFIKCERLQVEGIDYRSTPAGLHIRSIVARAPYARVIIESDRTINVKKVLKLKGAEQPLGGDAQSATPNAEATPAPTVSVTTAPAATSAPEATPTPGATSAPGATTPAPATPTASAETSSTRSRAKRHRAKAPADAEVASEGGMAMAIDSIRIENGSANYSDFWIQPHFAVGIQTLQGSIVGLSSSPSGRAKIDLQGKVDRYAPVHIWGETNPFAASGYTDIRMNFKGVEMVSATPYSGRFAGYKIEKGKLSVDIRYRIEKRQLTAEHRFVIEQLELGERVESPDAVHLPLKIALALLKDRNGVIDLNLPVTGSLDDPQFSIGPIIWKAVLNLFTKIATAPFALLGHLFGGGEQLNYIDFAPGRATLDPPAQDKLAALVRALKEKEKLQLDVPLVFSADVDRPGLAATRLNDQLLALRDKQPRAHKQAAADPLTDPADRYHLLLALFRAQQGKDAPLPGAAQAIEAAPKKQSPPPDFGPANSELEAVLLQKIPVPDSELEALGQQRARAIQDALLADGSIDPARVFIIGGEQKPTPEKDKVRVELALK